MAAGIYNVYIEQGVDFSAPVTVTDALGTPVDLTGCTYSAQIRRIFSSPDVVASFAVTTLGDSTQGNFNMTLPGSVSNAVALNRGTDYRLITTKFVYDCYILRPDGTELRLLQGTAEISPRVSQ